MPFMRVLFYLGWALLFLAFVGAAGEAIPRSLPGGAEGSSWFVSAYDLWYAAKPGSLVIAQIQVEKLSPVLWDPIIVALLALPTWLLFGGPGALLTWFFRPHKEITAELREDLQKQEESMLLFDKLAEDARAAGEYVQTENDFCNVSHNACLCFTNKPPKCQSVNAGMRKTA